MARALLFLLSKRRHTSDGGRLFAFAALDDAQGVADPGSMQFTGDDRYSLIVGRNVTARDKFKAAVGLKIEDKCIPEVLSSVVHGLAILPRAVTSGQRVFGCPVPLHL